VTTQAAEFPIGIYFEANGHGTVLFQPQVIDQFTAAHTATSDPAVRAGNINVYRNALGSDVNGWFTNLIPSVPTRQLWLVC